MNLNPMVNLQLNSNLTQTLPQLQELSPLNRKNIFSKTKKTLQPQSKEFNPHLERLNTNYYVKDSSIVPYSYTVTQNCMSRHNQFNLSRNLLKIHKAKSSGSKILSLREFSCIQTVSQKSGKENDSDQNSSLEISTNFNPKQINSQISSPFQFKNFQSTFTSANLKNSQLNFMKSHEIPKASQTQSFPIKTNKIKLINNEAQNDRKTNKIPLYRKNKIPQNFTLSKRVLEVKISPQKKGLSFSKRIDVHESSVIFDYNKFCQKSRSPQRKQNSIFHPINQKLFKFFGQEKQKDNTLKISNQNESFIDIVNEINSPVNKAPYQHLFLKKAGEKTRLNGDIPEKDNLFSSDLTCLVREGPRSFSVGNQLRKLSGHKNNFSQSKRESITMKTQTRPTSGRSQIFNQIELFTPSKESSQKPSNENRGEFSQFNKFNFKAQTENNNSNGIFLKTQNDPKIMRIIRQNDTSPLKNHHNSPSLSLQQKTHLNQKKLVQWKSNSNDSKRRSSKGITVLSKQKKYTNTQTKPNEHPAQNIIMTSKLKSVREIKNLKRLSLFSPKKIETCQAGSPIRYKKH